MWRHERPALAFVVFAFTLVVAFALASTLSTRAAAAAPRVHQHGFGFGYHTVLFRAESSDSYAIHGPSLVYDYFIGRRWGFMLRGAAYFPVFGSMSGPSGDYSGPLLDLYNQRHFGFDGLFMLARRLPLDDALILTVGGGAHMQSFALAGSEYSPVEDVSLGVGGLGKLDYALNDWLSASVQLAVGLDLIDLVDHLNPVQLVVPLSGSFAFAARY